MWQIRANSSHAWQICSNVKVKRICQMWKIRTYLSHLFIRANISQMWQIVKDSYDFFSSVIGTHDMCDKFIKKKSIWNAFIFTTAYLPKRNTMLSKENCWEDSRLFLRRLGIGRTRRWVSRLNRNLFCPSVAQLDIEASLIGKFHPNPPSSFWGDAITRQIKDGRRRSCFSTDRIFFLLAQLDIEGNILTKI